jgi:hypothetical protein
MLVKTTDAGCACTTAPIAGRVCTARRECTIHSAVSTPVLSDSLAVEIGADDVFGLGEQETGFFPAAAADEHTFAVGAARADMPRGFLEQPELGENPAGQRDFLGELSIAGRTLDFEFAILDCRPPEVADTRAN